MLSKILRKVKVKYKRKLFSERATLGENVNITAGCACSSVSKESITIGSNCDLADCSLYTIGEGKITVGDYSTIRYNSKISSVCGVEIGRYAIISNNVRIYDHNSHPTDPQTRIDMCKSGFYGDAWSCTKADKKPVGIEENVWIGEPSVILKGVRIGKGSIVASNSVVTKDVPPYSVVAGNPAKVVKRFEEYLNEEA